jgi:hypothetical protein
MRGHQIGGPEPDCQRQIRAVQDRPRRSRGLLAAGDASEGEGLAAAWPGFLVTAPGSESPKAGAQAKSKQFDKVMPKLSDRLVSSRLAPIKKKILRDLGNKA